MKRLTTLFAAALAIALALSGCAQQPSGQGWVTLIDGDKGMGNWYVTGTAANWRGEDGAIQADKTTGKGASVLASKRTFRDFELVVEFWASDDTNSGVYIRAPNPQTINTASGAYEVQIWDYQLLENMRYTILEKEAA